MTGTVQLRMECGTSVPPSGAGLGPRRRSDVPGEADRRGGPLKSGAEAPQSDTGFSRWHHAPLHVLIERGVYMLTAGTNGKAHFFGTPERLDLLTDSLSAGAAEFGWELHAWAVLANHYHFVACSPAEPATLRRFLNKLHMTTAKAVNRLDGTPGRKVWFQYWDTHLTYERSYLARLNYVNQNPVRHGLTSVAGQYRWCSAGHFNRDVSPAFQRTIAAIPIDRLEVEDDF